MMLCSVVWVKNSHIGELWNLETKMFYQYSQESTKQVVFSCNFNIYASPVRCAVIMKMRCLVRRFHVRERTLCGAGSILAIHGKCYLRQEKQDVLFYHFLPVRLCLGLHHSEWRKREGGGEKPNWMDEEEVVNSYHVLTCTLTYVASVSYWRFNMIIWALAPRKMIKLKWILPLAQSSQNCVQGECLVLKVGS